MRRILGGALLATALAAAPVVAQGTGATVDSPWGFGIKGGLVLPIGDLGEASSTGWVFGGFATWGGSTTLPLGFRGEVVYYGLGEAQVSGFGTTASSDVNVLAGTANLVYLFSDPNTTSSLMPYFIGGVGLYRVGVELSCSGTGCAGFPTGDFSDTQFGFNAGIGTSLPLGGLNTFGEARLHAILDGAGGGNDSSIGWMVPITVGIRF